MKLIEDMQEGQNKWVGNGSKPVMAAMIVNLDMGTVSSISGEECLTPDFLLD